MKVIQDNRLASRFRFPLRVRCQRCKSELEADKPDLKESRPDPRGYDTKGYWYVDCPLCHAQNEVKPHPLGEGWGPG